MSSRSGSADTFNPRSNSTVRPRRLISVDDVNDSNGQQPSSTGLSTMRSSELPALRSRGATPSPRPSRTVSPMPVGHPSRATQPHSSSRPGNSLGGYTPNGKYQDPFAESSRAAVDFLDASWSSLQGLASSILGSDVARPTTNGAPRSHARKSSRPDYFMKRAPSSSTWGPSGPNTPEIGANSQERQAMVQAKKMEALLLADTDPSWNLNSKHKRRDSSDRPTTPGIEAEQDEDALVYVHRVQAADSITGVTIRYGCQAAIFRKANGFWPSDSIQGRNAVLLPVDCCSVKGRPVQPKKDLLQEAPSRPSIEDTSGSSIVPEPSPKVSAFPTLEQTSNDPETESDQLWKHESWVQIDGFSEPVEIGRVPRRSLGFFSRTRRKSTGFSDAESMRGREQTPTIPEAPVPPMSPQDDWRSEAIEVDSPQSPASSTLRPAGKHRRKRSGLELSGTGVGTLDRTANLPGPAMDGLSKFFAQHMPTLAPKQAPPNFDGLGENSTTAASNNSTSLDNIGGAVEGWVRKMTARAKSGLNDLQQGPGPQHHGLPQGSRRRGYDDLIELDDGMESRNSPSLLDGPTLKPDMNRSGSSYANGSNLRGRFPSASPSTSRTRTGLDRYKDD